MISTGPDACRVCCQGDNEPCMPLESITEFLSDGVPCIIDGVNGACINVSNDCSVCVCVHSVCSLRCVCVYIGVCVRGCVCVCGT